MGAGGADALVGMMGGAANESTWMAALRLVYRLSQSRDATSALMAAQVGPGGGRAPASLNPKP